MRLASVCPRGRFPSEGDVTSHLIIWSITHETSEIASAYPSAPAPLPFWTPRTHQPRARRTPNSPFWEPLYVALQSKSPVERKSCESVLERQAGCMAFHHAHHADENWGAIRPSMSGMTSQSRLACSHVLYSAGRLMFKIVCLGPCNHFRQQRRRIHVHLTYSACGVSQVRLQLDPLSHERRPLHAVTHPFQVRYGLFHPPWPVFFTRA